MRRARVLTAALPCAAVLLMLPTVAPPASAQDETAAVQPLTFDQIFDRASFGAAPMGVAWSPQGDRLAYLWDDGSGLALWLLAPGDGEPTKVLQKLDTGSAEAAEEEAAAEEIPAGLAFGTEFSWAPDGSALLVTGGGDLWWVPAGGDEPRRLTATDDEEAEARVSPDGRHVAFVRDYDLFVLPVGSDDGGGDDGGARRGGRRADHRRQ